MKIKLKEEKKKLLELIRTRTPPNLLLSLEIGRGLGIERWVECAWVREFEVVEERFYEIGEDQFKTYLKEKRYDIYFKSKRSIVGWTLYEEKGFVYIGDILTSVGEYAFLEMLNLTHDEKNYYNPAQLHHLIREYFINYIKYILPHEPTT